MTNPPAERASAGDPAVLDLPLQTRMDVRLMPDTAIAETRTIEVVWSTGAAVRRRDPWSGRVYEESFTEFGGGTGLTDGDKGEDHRCEPRDTPHLPWPQPFEEM